MTLEFKTPLPPVKKQKTLASIREIQVHKHWTKVYSRKGLTAMNNNHIHKLTKRGLVGGGGGGGGDMAMRKLKKTV